MSNENEKRGQSGNQNQGDPRKRQDGGAQRPKQPAPEDAGRGKDAGSGNPSSPPPWRDRDADDIDRSDD